MLYNLGEKTFLIMTKKYRIHKIKDTFNHVKIKKIFTAIKEVKNK